MPPLLTVLTATVPGTRQRLLEDARRRVRPLLKPGVARPAVSPYPGHYALVRSVVEGLRAIDADFNFNPRRLSEVGRVVYAPANEALLQAITLKRQGRIDYLVAGPVNALFADECDGILLRPEIDRLIVASEWAAEFFREFPEAFAKCRACPCGVDAEWWQPSAASAAAGVATVYWKGGEERLCEQVERLVRACGLEPKRIRALPGEHAIFAAGDYRRVLDQSSIAVFLSTFETQGLALAEAWSMDVPTLVWDPRGRTEWRGRGLTSGSSAPYLTPATGRLWRTIDELEPVLRGALAERSSFQPRAWVKANMTDAICSAALLEIIREGAASSIGHGL